MVFVIFIICGYHTAYSGYYKGNMKWLLKRNMVVIIREYSAYHTRNMMVIIREYKEVIIKEYKVVIIREYSGYHRGNIKWLS